LCATLTATIASASSAKAVMTATSMTDGRRRCSRQ
jgi:hypothetical protein